MGPILWLHTNTGDKAVFHAPMRKQIMNLDREELGRVAMLKPNDLHLDPEARHLNGNKA